MFLSVGLLEQFIEKLNTLMGTNFELGEDDSEFDPIVGVGVFYLDEEEEYMLEVSKLNGETTIRVGYDSGWIAGLERNECFFGGIIEEFTPKGIQDCLDKYFGKYELLFESYSAKISKDDPQFHLHNIPIKEPIADLYTFEEYETYCKNNFEVKGERDDSRSFLEYRKLIVKVKDHTHCNLYVV